MDVAAALARRFIQAFNERDLDGFVSTLHPRVVIHAGRGDRHGIEEARAWGTRAPGGIQQRILVDEVRSAGDRVAALIVREWWWDEDDDELAEQAGANVMAWLFELRDGLIADWRAFDDRDEALHALAAPAP